MHIELRPLLSIMLCACLLPVGAAAREVAFPSSMQPETLTPWARTEFSRKALALIREGRHDEAALLIQTSLKLNVMSPEAHLLNALNYHAQARNGAGYLYPLARQGYELALKFDKSNWLAHYLLGHLHFETGNFPEASERFAETALFKPNARDVLYSLSVSCYHANRLDISAGILTRLANEGEPDTMVLRTTALVMAAVGDTKKSGEYFRRYRERKNTADDMEFLKERIDDWTAFHRSNENKPQDGAQSASPPPQSATALAVPDAPESGGAAKNMIMLDVVLLGLQKVANQAKGFNLLEGLQLQFGADANGTSGLSYKQVSDNVIAVGNGTVTQTITRAVNIPAINYSLNIFNSRYQKGEVIASPTLVALSGTKSEFFSGTSINAAAVGGANGSGSTVKIDKDIGIKLSVTPKFLSEDKVEIELSAERTFLTTPNTTAVTYTYRIDTSKTSISANVVVNFEDTLLIGGVTEKETIVSDSGVPVIKDIPVINTFFSHNQYDDVEKSMLILVTPRRPHYIPGNRANTGASEAHSSSLDEFIERNTGWLSPLIHPAPNVTHREIRRGDIIMPDWIDTTLHGSLEYRT